MSQTDSRSPEEEISEYLQQVRREYEAHDAASPEWRVPAEGHSIAAGNRKVVFVYTPADAGKITGWSAQQIDQRCNDGLILRYFFRKKPVIDVESLWRYLERVLDWPRPADAPARGSVLAEGQVQFLPPPANESGGAR
jgi:hypothetical protein